MKKLLVATVILTVFSLASFAYSQGFIKDKEYSKMPIGKIETESIAKEDVLTFMEDIKDIKMGEDSRKVIGGFVYALKKGKIEIGNITLSDGGLYPPNDFDPRSGIIDNLYRHPTLLLTFEIKNPQFDYPIGAVQIRFDRSPDKKEIIKINELLKKSPAEALEKICSVIKDTGSLIATVEEFICQIEN